MDLTREFKSVIEWENPQEWQLFYKYTDKGAEIKNKSKLIIQPGQGCIFTYEGKIQGVFTEQGSHDLKTSNKPFLTKLWNFITLQENVHRVGIWFYRAADILNIRWGTRIPIKYNDPVYGFPVNLRGYGNYSIKITNAEYFFTNVIAGQLDYFTNDLQELFLSRITQPISNYLANAKFSYAEIDSNIELIAKDAQERTIDIFNELGFKLLDFRIEGTSFDNETNKRIGEISDVQAEVKAAQLAGVNFAELQKLKAMRDAAKNEGTAGANIAMMTGVNMGQQMQQNPTPSVSNNSGNDIRTKLQDLKALFEDELISEEEYNAKKADLLNQM